MLRFYFSQRGLSTAAMSKMKIHDKSFECDEFTNIPPKIFTLLNRNLYLTDEHPLSLIRQRIVNYFHQNFKGRTGNSIFSVHDRLHPVVTTYQNFDSLLIPKDHISRSQCNCYYVNGTYLLRSHMTAHQSDLIKMGLNNFLMVGDVFRRDNIDRNHYPVFHQLDGVRLFSPQELLLDEDDGIRELNIRREGVNQRSDDCQESYTIDASKKVADNLKKSLEGLCKELFGEKVQYRWTLSYFPFTHPSWELEILLNDVWCEVLGCGVVEDTILREAGCENRIGWAFGLGLERLAMILYSIPDIRVFWSTDTGFTSQFKGKKFTDKIIYKRVSVHPQCKNHISFWLPQAYSSNEFYDLVREIGGEFVEQVHLIDEFENKNLGKTSHCYEIIYRHMEKPLSQKEVNEIHKRIEEVAKSNLKVEIR